jgi:uncharacterized protein
MSRMRFPSAWSMRWCSGRPAFMPGKKATGCHCGDAAAFLGLAGNGELAPYPDAVDSLRDACRRYGWPEERVEDFLPRLDKKGEPTAYLFRCLHCGRHLAYWDIG